MYYYGGGSFNSFPSCGCNMQSPWWGYPSCGSNNNNYAIVLVLFILLVIVIGARYTR